MKKLLKLTAIMLLLMESLVSCEKTETDTNLFGMYVQIYPESTEQTRINFISGTKLEIINSQSEEFIYSIQGNTIKLTTVTHNPTITTEFYFQEISNRKFEIGYLDAYFMIGLTPPNMIFEKE